MTSIWERAFARNQLTSVVIPSSVINILDDVFKNNWSSQDSENITDWVSWNDGIWELNYSNNPPNWIKQ